MDTVVSRVTRPCKNAEILRTFTYALHIVQTLQILIMCKLLVLFILARSSLCIFNHKIWFDLFQLPYEEIVLVMIALQKQNAIYVQGTFYKSITPSVSKRLRDCTILSVCLFEAEGGLRSKSSTK